MREARRDELISLQQRVGEEWAQTLVGQEVSGVGALLGWPASTDLQRCPVALQALPSLHAALPCPTPHSPEQLPVIPAAILS